MPCWSLYQVSFETGITAVNHTNGSCLMCCIMNYIQSIQCHTIHPVDMMLNVKRTDQHVIWQTSREVSKQREDGDMMHESDVLLIVKNSFIKTMMGDE